MSLQSYSFISEVSLPWICHSWQSCCLWRKMKMCDQRPMLLWIPSTKPMSTKERELHNGSRDTFEPQGHNTSDCSPSSTQPFHHITSITPNVQTLCLMCICAHQTLYLPAKNTCANLSTFTKTHKHWMWLLTYRPTGWRKGRQWPQRTPDLQHVVYGSLQIHTRHCHHIINVTVSSHPPLSLLCDLFLEHWHL